MLDDLHFVEHETTRSDCGHMEKLQHDVHSCFRQERASAIGWSHVQGVKMYRKLTLCAAGLFFESLTSCCGLQESLVKRDISLLCLPGKLLGDATSLNGIINRLQSNRGQQSTERAGSANQAARV